MEATTAPEVVGGFPGSARGPAISVLRAILAAARHLVGLAAGVGVLDLIRVSGASAGNRPRSPRCAAAPAARGRRGPAAAPHDHRLGSRRPRRRAGARIAYESRSPVLAPPAWWLWAATVLLIAGAAADAIAITDPLESQPLPQLARAGTWMAVVLFALGSSLAVRMERGANGGE